MGGDNGEEEEGARREGRREGTTEEGREEKQVHQVSCSFIWFGWASLGFRDVRQSWSQMQGEQKGAPPSVLAAQMRSMLPKLKILPTQKQVLVIYNIQSKSNPINHLPAQPASAQPQPDQTS